MVYLEKRNKSEEDAVLKSCTLSRLTGSRFESGTTAITVFDDKRGKALFAAFSLCGRRIPLVDHKSGHLLHLRFLAGFGVKRRPTDEFRDCVLQSVRRPFCRDS